MKFIILGVFLCLPLCAQAADSSIASFICEVVTDDREQAQCLERASAVTKGSSTTDEGAPVWFSPLLSLVWWIVYYGLGLLIGWYLYRDARRREWIFLGIRPVWWAALALFQPAMGLLVYWALHYSKFAQNYYEATGSTASSAPE